MLMKSYQWLTLSAAVAITVFLHLFFTGATSVVSPIATGAEVVRPEAGPAADRASQVIGRDKPSRSGETP